MWLFVLFPKRRSSYFIVRGISPIETTARYVITLRGTAVKQYFTGLLRSSELPYYVARLVNNRVPRRLRSEHPLGDGLRGQLLAEKGL